MLNSVKASPSRVVHLTPRLRSLAATVTKVTRFPDPGEKVPARAKLAVSAAMFKSVPTLTETVRAACGIGFDFDISDPSEFGVRMLRFIRATPHVTDPIGGIGRGRVVGSHGGLTVYAVPELKKAKQVWRFYRNEWSEAEHKMKPVEIASDVVAADFAELRSLIRQELTKPKNRKLVFKFS